tara:strand:- start:185 stop:358 length:174 start_codon:yes stop_codon:yes gene_type:complete
MQTRIQLTIKDEDKEKLFDKQLEAIDEISMLLKTLPFKVDLHVFDREPEEEIHSHHD